MGKASRLIGSLFAKWKRLDQNFTQIKRENAKRLNQNLTEGIVEGINLIQIDTIVTVTLDIFDQINIKTDKKLWILNL